MVSNEEQKTYELKTVSSDGNGKYTIELKLIGGESHVDIGVFSGRFSLFVDGTYSYLSTQNIMQHAPTAMLLTGQQAL